MIVSVKKRECLFWYALVVMQIFILLVTVKSNRVAIATLLRVPVRGFFYILKLYIYNSTLIDVDGHINIRKKITKGYKKSILL